MVVGVPRILVSQAWVNASVEVLNMMTSHSRDSQRSRILKEVATSGFGVQGLCMIG